VGLAEILLGRGGQDQPVEVVLFAPGLGHPAVDLGLGLIGAESILNRPLLDIASEIGRPSFLFAGDLFLGTVCGIGNEFLGAVVGPPFLRAQRKQSDFDSLALVELQSDPLAGPAGVWQRQIEQPTSLSPLAVTSFFPGVVVIFEVISSQQSAITR